MIAIFQKYYDLILFVNHFEKFSIWIDYVLKFTLSHCKFRRDIEFSIHFTFLIMNVWIFRIWINSSVFRDFCQKYYEKILIWFSFSRFNWSIRDNLNRFDDLIVDTLCVLLFCFFHCKIRLDIDFLLNLHT